MKNYSALCGEGGLLTASEYLDVAGITGKVLQQVEAIAGGKGAKHKVPEREVRDLVGDLVKEKGGAKRKVVYFIMRLLISRRLLCCSEKPFAAGSRVWVPGRTLDPGYAAKTKGHDKGPRKGSPRPGRSAKSRDQKITEIRQALREERRELMAIAGDLGDSLARLETLHHKLLALAK